MTRGIDGCFHTKALIIQAEKAIIACGDNIQVEAPVGASGLCRCLGALTDLLPLVPLVN